MGQAPTFRETLDRLGRFVKQERSLLFFIFVYAIAVGLFSLIIPFSVQELVNTFAFAVTPVMVVTLVGIMAGILLFVGFFRVLQFYATDILERRIFVRVSLALAELLPRFKEKTFSSNSINRFFETVFLQRAFSNLFVDLTNVLVGGAIGMILLVFYHPYFLVFDIVLIISVVIIAFLGKGGFQNTIKMSEAKYEAFHWLQEVANNLIHFKATNCANLIFQKTDSLATSYVLARKRRFKALIRQYIGSLFFQVIMHVGLLGTAGWLLSQGQLTLGQLVAAEVIVASLLLNLDSVVKRTYVVFYFFTALVELDHLYKLPTDELETGSGLPFPSTNGSGLHLSCSHLSWTKKGGVSQREINFEAQPGEKWALVCPTESIRMRISLALAGLDQPANGVVRYNGIDIKSLSTEQVNEQRGILFGRDLSLFEGSIAENIIMGRNIATEDLIKALRLSLLDGELANFSDGLETMIVQGGKHFSPSQRYRILLARAIVGNPSLLILDGVIHKLPIQIREPLVRKLISDDCTSTLIIVSTDPQIENYTDKFVEIPDDFIE
ncbi:MAG: ATP-binding cassette domain-containing protein [Candidatus Nitronauta litoralis]|uniref:ATP-binding cassette domain-containing protein n=1 Tax=Candidatus Nitronauta litoralis TaxID=2705533 RepID=A0A7T0G1D3_9BACT|nr:MAG: ATP-binding cassette domain-containing protein [Candidatus Nitronauta litoralis]